MSDRLEQRIRAAYDGLPGPHEEETAFARSRVLATAVRTARPRRARRRAPAFALAALVTAVAFGGGWAVASSLREPAKPAPRSKLDAGPGFLPAVGWDVVASSAVAPPQTPVAVAANVRLSSEDRALAGLPQATARRLGPNGVLFHVRFAPAGTIPSAAERLLPLQLRHAARIEQPEGLAGVGSARRLRARVGRYDVDVLVVFGAPSPAPGVVAQAAQQLGRLVVPACPAALPLAPADLPAAKRAVLDWLGTHYQEDPADLAGARAEATLGTSMPRAGAARLGCGAAIARRTVEVDVVLPRLEQVSASLSQLSYFVSKTPTGWDVWQRIH